MSFATRCQSPELAAASSRVATRSAARSVDTEGATPPLAEERTLEREHSEGEDEERGRNQDEEVAAERRPARAADQRFAHRGHRARERVRVSDGLEPMRHQCQREECPRPEYEEARREVDAAAAVSER